MVITVVTMPKGVVKHYIHRPQEPTVPAQSNFHRQIRAQAAVGKPLWPQTRSIEAAVLHIRLSKPNSKLQERLEAVTCMQQPTLSNITAIGSLRRVPSKRLVFQADLTGIINMAAKHKIPVAFRATFSPGTRPLPSRRR